MSVLNLNKVEQSPSHRTLTKVHIPEVEKEMLVPYFCYLNSLKKFNTPFSYLKKQLRILQQSFTIIS